MYTQVHFRTAYLYVLFLKRKIQKCKTHEIYKLKQSLFFLMIYIVPPRLSSRLIKYIHFHKYRRLTVHIHILAGYGSKSGHTTIRPPLVVMFKNVDSK